MTSLHKRMEDVTDSTGRQVLDDIFEESRMHRTELSTDVAPETLAGMELPSDPFVGFFRGSIRVDDASIECGQSLVVASARERRRYLLKRWNEGRCFRAYQITPVVDEKLRLLNVYRVMMGQPVGTMT